MTPRGEDAHGGSAGAQVRHHHLMELLLLAAADQLENLRELLESRSTMGILYGMRRRTLRRPATPAEVGREDYEHVERHLELLAVCSVR